MAVGPISGLFARSPRLDEPLDYDPTDPIPPRSAAPQDGRGGGGGGGQRRRHTGGNEALECRGQSADQRRRQYSAEDGSLAASGAK